MKPSMNPQYRQKLNSIIEIEYLIAVQPRTTKKIYNADRLMNNSHALDQFENRSWTLVSLLCADTQQLVERETELAWLLD